MRAIAALSLCLVAVTSAQAKPTRHDKPEFIGDRWANVQTAHGPLAGEVANAAKGKSKAKRRRAPKQKDKPGVVDPLPKRANILRRFADETINNVRSRTLSGVVGPLASKAREIESICGSRVISAVRHTYIRGTGGRLSLHASGRAVDIAGNPSCIYAQLRGWPGGVSVDYGRVRHVHVSYAPNGAEWGARFRHYRGGKRHRHARRRA